jgi:hypothetical protein
MSLESFGLQLGDIDLSCFSAFMIVMMMFADSFVFRKQPCIMQKLLRIRLASYYKVTNLQIQVHVCCIV